MKTRKLNLLMALILAVSTLVLGSPAQASASLDKTQVVTTPGVTVSDAVTITADKFCLSVTGPAGVKFITVEDLYLSFEWGIDPVELWPQTDRYAVTAGKATVCFQAGNWSDQLDLTQISNFALRGKIGFATFPSATLALQLKGLGLRLDKSYGLSFWFDSQANQTRLEASLENFSKAGVIYKLTSVTVNSTKFSGFNTMLYAAPGWQTWMNLGSASGDISKNLANAKVALKFSKVKATKLASSVKLPKGLKAQTFSPAGWGVESKKTFPCLPVTNTTNKEIWVSAKLVFAVGKAKSSSKGFGINTVPAKKSACLTGVDSTGKPMAGDLRIGKSAKVTGTVKVVKAPKFVTKGIVKPTGFSIKGTPWVTYDAKTKRSTITFTTTGPQGFNAALRLDKVKVNKKSLATSVVAGPCECGGPGYDYTSRTFRIENIPGDYRANVTATILGTLTSLPLTVVQGTAQVSTDPWQASCTIYHPEYWTYKSGVTSVAFACNNQSANPATFNVSQLQLKATTAGFAEQTYTAIVDTVTIPGKTQWREFTVFLVSGDARANATLAFIGDASISVN